MQGFVAALLGIYGFMQIHFNIAGYNISFMELFFYTLLASLSFFVARQIFDVDD